MNSMNNQTLQPGTLLRGKSYIYAIQKVLGQGTFGITYLATTKVKVTGVLGELETTMQVAIKEFFMRDINGRDENTVTTGSQGGIYANYKKKFAREAKNLSKLNHPHIVKVLEYFETNNTVYYAMEYIDGESLDLYITRQKGLPETECIQYTQQIGSALSYMHEHKMLHLDLKPRNIMLRKNKEAVLIDFGLSKQYDEEGKPESSTSIGNGTPGYAPIEQANYHEKSFPKTIDVYALGATMYKMLTGVRPPEASELLNEGFPTTTLQKCHASEQTIACIEKAMAILKKDRFQSVNEVLTSLKKNERSNTIIPNIDSEDTVNEHKSPLQESNNIGEKPIKEISKWWNFYYWLFSPSFLYLNVSPERRSKTALSLLWHPFFLFICLYIIKNILSVAVTNKENVEVFESCLVSTTCYYYLITSIVGMLLFIPAISPCAKRLNIPGGNLWLLLVLFILSWTIAFGVYQIASFFSAVIIAIKYVFSLTRTDEKLHKILKDSFYIVSVIIGAFMAIFLVVILLLIIGIDS